MTLEEAQRRLYRVEGLNYREQCDCADAIRDHLATYGKHDQCVPVEKVRGLAAQYEHDSRCLPEDGDYDAGYRDGLRMVASSLRALLPPEPSPLDQAEQMVVGPVPTDEVGLQTWKHNLLALLRRVKEGK